MGMEEVGARSDAGKHAVVTMQVHVGFIKKDQDFLAHFHTFQVLEKQVKFGEWGSTRSWGSTLAWQRKRRKVRWEDLPQ